MSIILNNNFTIQILYHKNIEPISKIVQGDWIDLRVAQNYSLKKGDFALVDLGISMKLPEGYEAYIAPRSSTFKKYGLIQTNSIGIIDNSYCGNNDIWMMPVYATRDVELKINDRICQFRIMEKMPALEFETVQQLNFIDRGGFGSTGKN